MENVLSGRTTKNLAGLYDRLESSLRALGTLGCTKDKFADFLAPLVESCLPDNLLRIWERQRSSEEVDKTKSTVVLEHLMKFLRNEVEGEERIRLIKESFGCRRPAETVGKSTTKKIQKEATAAALVSTEEIKTSNDKKENCVFCNK